MSDSTSIEWTDATWSPLRARRRDTGKVGQHCERVSPGCTNCYAAAHNRRNLPNGGTGLDYVRASRDEVETFVDQRVLSQPARWRAPRRIFVCNQTDLFADFYTDAQRDRALAVMAWARRHTYQILTKRPARAREYFAGIAALDPRARSQRLGSVRGIVAPIEACGELEWPLPNIWLGVTAEDQQRADERIPILLDTPAATRFVSAEPLLGPVDLRRDWIERGSRHHLGVDVEGMLRNRSFTSLQDGEGHPIAPDDARRELERLRDAGIKLIPTGGCDDFDSATGCRGHRRPSLDWVIVGGESGAGARPCHPEWIRSIVRQCRAADVGCFVKQIGVWQERRPKGYCRLSRRRYSHASIRFDPTGHEYRADEPDTYGAPGMTTLYRHGVEKGGDPSEWPEDLRVREFPRAREASPA